MSDDAIRQWTETAGVRKSNNTVSLFSIGVSVLQLVVYNDGACNVICAVALTVRVCALRTVQVNVDRFFIRFVESYNAANVNAEIR